MAYLDKISVGGTEYDIQDSKAARQTEVDELKSAVEQLEPGLSDDAKAALLNCFQHVAWIDEHGQDYYDALEVALYADSYPRITAVFDAGANVIYTDDTLDSLKQYLTVKYFETVESTGVVIASSNYNLSGTLAEGMSTVIVSYDGLTTSFTVAGVVDFYNIWEWSSSGNEARIIRVNGSTSEQSKTDLSYIAYSSAVDIVPKRRAFITNHGRTQTLYNKTTSSYSEYYPIPVPQSAKSVTVNVEPATQYIATYCFYAVGDQYMTTNVSDIKWAQGSQTIIFDNDNANRVITICGKYNSAGTDYEIEPNITVTFSE